MTTTLHGSCRCGAVRFAMRSRTPQPYQLCYCTICRKTAGGGGYAINLMAEAASLKIEGREAIGVYRAEIRGEDGVCEISNGERSFCTRCATALWLFSPDYQDLIHPFASAIDGALPVPPSRVHLMLKCKADWVVPRIDPGDETFDLYPDLSIEEWHRARGLWLE